jgi:trehalose 6-phosphate synthase
MSAADLIGLHVSRWCRNFADSCAEAGATIDRSTGSMSHDGMTSWIRSYPIPIDAGDLIERASSDGARKWAREFREWAGGGRLLARVDRSEPSKNIVRGFEAFGALLDRRPELADEIRFVACVYPSRQTMPEYRRYSEQIQSAVDRVLERHPGSIKLYSDDDFDRSLGALLAYDALLVNPLMDGMNLVSKEGPTLNQQDGVLILSSGAGSFEELGDSAVEITDPLDVGQTSMAIEKALEMPAPERKERAQELREAATARTPEDWIEAQLADLRSISDTGEPISPAPTL